VFLDIPGYIRAISGLAVPSDDHRDYIKKIVDGAPPLTAEQRARLRVLLRPVAVDPSTNVTTDGDTVLLPSNI
jgi:hypothetical protein